MIKDYWKMFCDSYVTKSQHFIELCDMAYGNAKKIRAGIDAYRENVIIYRYVNIIVQLARHVPWKVLKSKSGELIAN